MAMATEQKPTSAQPQGTSTNGAATSQAGQAQPGAQSTAPSGFDPQAFVSQLPEEYRSDPTKFLQAYQERDAKLRDLEQKYQQAQRYQEWYQQQWDPWWRQHQEDWQAFVEQRKRQGKPAEPAATARTAAPASEGMPDEEIDWSDPSAPEKAYRQAIQRARDLENKLLLQQQELEARTQQFLNLLHLQEQARQIEVGDLYQHLKYSPPRDVRKIAEHAMQKGITDLMQAADDLYRDTYFQQAETRGYERGKQEAMQELQNRRTVTEMTPGVPPRLTGRQSEIPKGYGATGREELLRKILEKNPSLQHAV